MGARVVQEFDGLPLTITGGALREIRWELPVASAQVKSAILLAAAAGRVPARIIEPAASRDHTERMLASMGYTLSTDRSQLSFEPTGSFAPIAIDVPGDPSSAIFLLAAALLAGSGEVTVDRVGLNPGRIAALHILSRMKAKVSWGVTADESGEPVGAITAAPSSLHGVVVGADEIPASIDEIPMLACLAARAEGVTRFCDVGELRVKESDRLEMIATNLRAIGAHAEVAGDDLIVEGSDRPYAGRVVTGGDHRIAMAFTVLGTEPRNAITVDDPDCAAVSFPGFAATLSAIFTRSAS